MLGLVSISVFSTAIFGFSYSAYVKYQAVDQEIEVTGARSLYLSCSLWSGNAQNKVWMYCYNSNADPWWFAPTAKVSNNLYAFDARIRTYRYMIFVQTKNTNAEWGNNASNVAYQTNDLDSQGEDFGGNAVKYTITTANGGTNKSLGSWDNY